MAHTLEKEGEQKGEEEGLQESRLREKILELVEDGMTNVRVMVLYKTTTVQHMGSILNTSKYFHVTSGILCMTYLKVPYPLLNSC